MTLGFESKHLIMQRTAASFALFLFLCEAILKSFFLFILRLSEKVALR